MLLTEIYHKDEQNYSFWLDIKYSHKIVVQSFYKCLYVYEVIGLKKGSDYYFKIKKSLFPTNQI